MLKRFLHTTFRNFKKNRSYTLINVLGLALGITCSLLIFVVIDFELSFDTFHAKKDRVYRINTNSIRPSGVFGVPASPYPIAGALRSDFPEIEEVAMVRYDGGGQVEVQASGERREFQEERGVVVTSQRYFNIFDVEWLAGQPSVLASPNSAVISESLAIKYFGSESPDKAIGQTIMYNDQYSLVINGVVKDAPPNSDMPFSLYISERTFQSEIDYEQWGRIDYSIQHYLLLAEGTNAKALEDKFPAMIEKYTSERYAKMMVNVLQPLSTLHFDTTFGNFNQRTVAKSTIYSLGIIGLVLLITACINFVNLATAYASKRSKEVGIRKVLGSNRRHLVQYFIGETSIITGIAVLLSVLFAYLLYPAMVDIIGFEPGLNFLENGNLILFIILTSLFVIVASGVYPAILCSAFEPADVLKSTYSTRPGGLLLRKGLVVLQFAISQVLIICTLIVTFQMDYFMNKDLGYNHEAIVTMQLPDGVGDHETLRNTLLAIPEVAHCTFSNGAASSSNRWMNSYAFDGSTDQDRYVAQMKYGDENYIKTFEMDLIAGRSYVKSDTLDEIVINEKMAREMGIQDPQEALGKIVDIGRSGGNRVVGVVSDFNLVSLHEPIIAAAIGCSESNYRVVNVKLHKDKIREGIEKIESAWNGLYPEANFDFQFLDETLAAFYETEQRISELFRVFAVIAVFIGCLGLFGLVSFIANQRIKEVGVRKVLGASVLSIMYLFSKDFVKLVLIAFLIAAPISYYYMQEWLTSFTYRIDMNAAAFIGAMVGSILMALMTMSYRSYIAATSNPVDTLRNE